MGRTCVRIEAVLKTGLFDKPMWQANPRSRRITGGNSATRSPASTGTARDRLAASASTPYDRLAKSALTQPFLLWTGFAQSTGRPTRLLCHRSEAPLSRPRNVDPGASENAVSSLHRKFSWSLFANPWTKKARCPRRNTTITRNPPSRPVLHSARERMYFEGLRGALSRKLRSLLCVLRQCRR